MNQVAEAVQEIAGTVQLAGMPELAEGEIYICSIKDVNGRGHHTILLPGEKDYGNWKDAVAWAKKQSGDLPDRIEQAVLFARFKEQFQEDVYWSNSTHASYTDCAWCQYFFHGTQYWLTKSTSLVRARAVRRVLI